jgi:hypothetical protein
MPNRNLQAKHDRAMRQRQERAHIEYSKSGYATARPFEADTGNREYLPEPKTIKWFERGSKLRAYEPTPAKRRAFVSPPLLDAWTMDNREWRELTHNGRVILRGAE